MTVLVIAEHDRGALAPATLEACTFARALGEAVHAITVGAAADGLVAQLAEFGVSLVVQAHHDLLADYGPEAWGETVAQLVRHYAELGAHAQHGDVQQGLSAAAQARLVDHDRQVRHRIQQTIAEGMAAGDFRADLDPGTDAVLIHGLLGGVQSACASADRVSDVVRASIRTALAALSD